MKRISKLINKNNFKFANKITTKNGAFTSLLNRNKNTLIEMKMKEFGNLRKYYSTETPLKPMFCFQCEQTEHATGCTTKGVCGKTPEISRLQDLLMHAVKGLGCVLAETGKMGIRLKEGDKFIITSLFASMTNVNFDDQRYVKMLQEAENLLKKAKYLYSETCKKRGIKEEEFPEETNYKFNSNDVSILYEEAKQYGIEKRKLIFGDDYVGLQELIFYGLKGTAAYADHASVMGFESDLIYQQICQVLQFLTEKHSVPELLSMALHVGEINLKVMDLLDSAHTFKFGNPEPTVIRTSAVKGKCILISGHDISDLEELLKQTEGKGINVYTHGELLPANGYPELKKYKHLIGNYGGAWQNQKYEFPSFPGPIVITSNCITEPKESYKERIWTRTVVGYKGIKHMENNDYKKIIEQALLMPGFLNDEKFTSSVTGFSRHSILSIANTIVNSVRSGSIKHFFLIGGCDGYEKERNYFKEVALSTPPDTVILTLACGKYRFNKLEFGDIGGIPRLLDMGQCNDAFSAIQVASALANAFNCQVNELPLSFVVSWLEQKSVAILLTLLHLNIQNIRLGTSLPAFVTPNMLNILVEKFKIKPITDPKKDIEEMMNNK